MERSAVTFKLKTFLSVILTPIAIIMFEMHICSTYSRYTISNKVQRYCKKWHLIEKWIQTYSTDILCFVFLELFVYYKKKKISIKLRNYNMLYLLL